MSAATTIMSTRCKRPRSCSTPTGARRSSSPTPRTSPSRKGSTLVEDEGLLEEVAGLVEWPVVLMGEFEPAFLDLPPEVIRATIRANQKCFVLREAPGRSSVMAGPLDPDDPAIHGAPSGAQAARALRRRTAWMAGARPAMTRERARASSPTSSSSSRTSSRPTAARRSRPATGASCARASPTRATSGRPTSRPCPTPRTRAAKPLDQRLEKLERVVFHEKLGTQGERIARIEALARELAPKVGADPDACGARGASRQGRSRDRNGRRVS